MAAEFKNELLKAQSGRFNINFNFDQMLAPQGQKSTEEEGGEGPSRGVITKEVKKTPPRKESQEPQEIKKKPRKVRRIDRGGCLALIALLSFVLILSLAVFSLLYPTLTKQLYSILF